MLDVPKKEIHIRKNGFEMFTGGKSTSIYAAMDTALFQFFEQRQKIFRSEKWFSSGKGYSSTGMPVDNVVSDNFTCQFSSGICPAKKPEGFRVTY